VPYRFAVTPAAGAVECSVKAFLQFGRIVNIDLKTNGRPPAYAFIEFDHPRCVLSLLACRTHLRQVHTFAALWNTMI
jgi:RNA recognition motif. (a.k.a. RRM, RBD, or RNP domain)